MAEMVYIRTFSVFLFNKVMAASTEAVYSQSIGKMNVHDDF